MGSSKCCTIFAGGVVSGVYATAAYLAACCMEIGWLVESDGLLPAPSFILAGAYFFTLVVSAVLLIGIARKKTRFLLVWLFFMGIIFLPECGLVLYMTLRFWTLSHLNGIMELTFYICRAVINVLAFVCIQSLLRRWRQEKAVMRRLEFLNIGPVFRETNGHNHRKSDGEYMNGHGSTMAYTNPLPIEPELYGPVKNTSARSPSSNIRGSTGAQVPVIPYANGNAPTSPRELFNARAAFWSAASRSEFDAASFTDYIINRPRPLSELGVVPGNSRSHTDLPTTVFSLEGGWDRGDSEPSELGYATQSLERPRFRQQQQQQQHLYSNISRRSRSLEDMHRTMMSQIPGDVYLERIQEQPFQYLHRPGVITYREESDLSDTHSIRDIAL